MDESNTIRIRSLKDADVAVICAKMLNDEKQFATFEHDLWEMQLTEEGVREAFECSDGVHAVYVLTTATTATTATTSTEPRIIGEIQLHSYDPDTKAIEIGYFLFSDAEGNGYMTKAINALKDHIFTTMDVDQLIINCGMSNARSAAVALRCGFTEGLNLEKIFCIERQFTFDIADYNANKKTSFCDRLMRGICCCCRV